MQPHGRKRTFVRGLWFTAGCICLFFGTLGIVLPILPTTPFLLAAAACFCNSSNKMYSWLLNNRYFGSYIRNYKEGKGLSLKTKITALMILWVTIAVSVVFFLERLLPEDFVLLLKIVMLAVALGVSVHILKLPTFKHSSIIS